jgi:hypothetical protein
VKQVQSLATATQRRDEFVCIQGDPAHLSPAPYIPNGGDTI